MHELGHFLTAKLAGIRVDEFGIGFPPRLFSVRYGETEYSINIVPFGGFVKIFGESPDEIEGASTEEKERSFTAKTRGWQALVLVAGVVCNMFFAWILISLGFMIGQPTPIDYGGDGVVQNPKLTVLEVQTESPADNMGIRVGDTIESVATDEETLIAESLSVESFQSFVHTYQEEEITLVYKRGEEYFASEGSPVEGLIEGKKGLGVAIDMIGTLQLPVHTALSEGFLTTVDLTKTITIELGKFFGRLFVGAAHFSEVTGPIGIVSLVGNAAQLGIVHVLAFTAVISIHLAVINLVPIPALDGGRLLFVAIEAIIRKPVPQKVFIVANLIGFIFLVALMIVVTYSDIVKLLF